MVAEPMSICPREVSRSRHSQGGCPGLLQEHSSAPLKPLPGAVCLLEHPRGKVALALKVLLSVGITNLKNCAHLRLRT